MTQHELHEWCLVVVGLDCWRGSQKGIKRQRKTFSGARAKLTYSETSSNFFSSCFLWPVFLCFTEPFPRNPFGTTFFWDGVFFNKRRKPPSLVPLPSFHGFTGLKWLTQHHCGISPYQSAVLFFCGVFLTWNQSGMPQLCVTCGQTRGFDLWQGRVTLYAFPGEFVTENIYFLI